MDWPSWNDVFDAVRQFGWTKGVFTIFFFMAHAWIWKEYRGRLQDHRKQIDALAAENRQYRELFLGLIDKKFDFNPGKKTKRPEKENNDR